MSIIKAVEDFISLFKGECNDSPMEIRLHPEDYDELRADVIAKAYTQSKSSGTTEFLGVKIILDSSVPRLPRK